MKISITCGVRDRAAHLRESLPTWLACPEVGEVVVVDWSGVVGLQLPSDPRIRHVRVIGQKHWHASKCHNLEIRLASGTHVLRLDADVMLDRAFFERHIPGAVHFYRLDYDDARRHSDDAIHLAGVIFAPREDLLRAGGYCERLRTYGKEDEDLVARLSEDLGLSAISLDVGVLHHIPHDDDLRTVNQPVDEYVDLHVKPGYAGWQWGVSLTQRSVAMNEHELALNPWVPGKDRMAGFEVVVGEGIWEAREVVRPSTFQSQKLGARLQDDDVLRGIDLCERGVSIVCGCRDRAGNLVQSAGTWACDPRVTEIVIVDWGSGAKEAMLISEIAGTLAARGTWVKLVRVLYETTWQPGPCFNLGLRFASTDKVLKLDADVKLVLNVENRATFFDEHVLEYETDFFAGDWLRARDDNERHLSGVVYAHRRALLQANGWNEKIVTYGYDDEDLYDRLGRLIMNRRRLNNGTLYHIPHTDTIRLQCQPGRVNSCLQEVEFNRQMAKSRPWRRDDALVCWEAAMVPRADGVQEFEVRRKP